MPTTGHIAHSIVAAYTPPDAAYLRHALARIATGVSVRLDADGDFWITRPGGSQVWCGKSPSLARLSYLMATQAADKPDPRDPDYSRPGIFATHNCWKCQSGKMPCKSGNPHDCEYPHARND